ncbi:hypothetical protein [Modestobacter marinus]|uniref:hypothetical protein n=1 Tax=Modestobacter marinus TaxID=477641 RepID=UPI001C95F7BA|nr:hypothetical protein [Modestobacter marinus]
MSSALAPSWVVAPSAPPGIHGNPCRDPGHTRSVASADVSTYRPVVAATGGSRAD